MESDMIERYEELAKKHNLPDYDSLDLEFEIYALEDAKYLLRAILEKMVRKIDDSVKILEDVLYPDSSSYSSIFETRAMSEADKDKILRLHKDLMIIVREALYLSMDYEEEELAKFICGILSKWQSIKPSLKKVALKLKQVWESENFENESVKYMG